MLCVFRTESDQVLDIQDGENATVESPSDTLICATLMLDPDSAAAPGTDTTKEIQIFITEMKDTASGMKYTWAFYTRALLFLIVVTFF